MKALERLVQEQQQRIEGLLLRTGRLEEEEALEAAQAANEKERAPAALETPPERPVTHQLVSLTFNGLLQAWYAGGNRGFRDTFRIRRSELYFNGAITHKARWQVMLDPAKALSLETSPVSLEGRTVLGSVGLNQSSRILQNVVITLDYIPRLHVSMGQFKLPLSLEGQQSSGRLETVERALFLSDRGRGGAYGDVRDLGFLVRSGIGSRVDYQLGVFNGVAESQNDVDRNDQKALAGSFVVRPWPGFQIGSSGAWGNGGGDRPRRDRLGADLQVARDGWMLKAELMTGNDGVVSRRGYYAHLGYRIAPKLEVVVRTDGWDPDTRSESMPEALSERDYLVGFNVLLNQHNLKLQANYVRKTFHDSLAPSRNVLLVNSQAFW